MCRRGADGALDLQGHAKALGSAQRKPAVGDCCHVAIVQSNTSAVRRANALTSITKESASLTSPSILPPR